MSNLDDGSEKQGVIKERFRKCIVYLIETSKAQSKSVQDEVRILIQLLIDGDLEPEDFCISVERSLNISISTSYIDFLKNSIQLGRDMLATIDLKIDGIHPPVGNVASSIVSQTPTAQTEVTDGLRSSQVVPHHIVLESMDIARAFPLIPNSRILSTLETHMRLPSTVRIRITLRRIMQEMVMRENTIQINHDALIIQKIFPNLSTDVLTSKLQAIEDKSNRIQLVIKDILDDWQSSIGHIPILCPKYREVSKRKLTGEVTEIVHKKHLRSTESVPQNSSQILNMKDKISETRVRVDDYKSLTYKTDIVKMKLPSDKVKHSRFLNYLQVCDTFADWNLPSTSKSTNINVPVTEEPSSTTILEDSLSSDSAEVKIEDWSIPSTSNRNIPATITKELPSSTTIAENTYPDSQVEVQDYPIVEIEDKNSPTSLFPETIEIKDNMNDDGMIIDLVEEPKRMKIEKEEVLEYDKIEYDKTLYYKLMEIFPEADPPYLRKVCRNKIYSEMALNDIITTLLSVEYPKRSEQPAEVEDEDQPIDPIVQIEILKQVLPDADPMYLAKSLEGITTQDELKMFITRALEEKNYPTYKEYLRKQQVNAQAKQYTTEFDVEKFVSLIPDPKTYFNNLKCATSIARNSNAYYDAINFLKNHYNHIYSNHVKAVFDRYLNILATCEDLDNCKQKLLRNKRKPINTLDNVTDIPLLQVFAYIKNKQLISDFIEDKRKQMEFEREEIKRSGFMVTCGCCFDDEVIPNDSAHCTTGCIFCKSCIEKSVEVGYGEGKLDYFCLAACGAQFSVQTLQDAVKPKLFSKIAQKKQMEEVKAAGIEDLEFCPFCDFASIPPVGDKLFKCLNPECMKESCRQCKEPSHVPLRCEEVEKDADVKRRVFVEDKMTEALLRKCWKCGMKFIKSDGCNKMTCTCGAHMCYICNKPVTDYKHFNGQGGDQHNLCPLYSDTNLLHKEAVIKSAEAAKTEIGADGLKIDPAADIQSYYKDLMKKRPTPLPPGVHPAVHPALHPAVPARDPNAAGHHRMAQRHRGAPVWHRHRDW